MRCGGDELTPFGTLERYLVRLTIKFELFVVEIQTVSCNGRLGRVAICDHWRRWLPFDMQEIGVDLRAYILRLVGTFVQRAHMNGLRALTIALHIIAEYLYLVEAVGVEIGDGVAVALDVVGLAREDLYVATGRELGR